MALTDASGLPLSLWVGSASQHEVKLVEHTLQARFIEEKPERIIADRAYDSDPLRDQLEEQSIELIAPHRYNRSKPKRQDGRSLKRYKKRWKVERFFAWIQNARRCYVRYEYYLNNFLGFIQIASLKILLKAFLR
jgi:transposase